MIVARAVKKTKRAHKIKGKSPFSQAIPVPTRHPRRSCFARTCAVSEKEGVNL